MSGLPEGWILTSLGEIGQWGSGGTPSRKNHEYFGSGIPWIKSGDLPDGPILRTEEQITELGLKNSSAKLMPAGTISIAMYGATIGKLGLLTFPAATNQACANVIPQSQLIDRDYLVFYLLSERQALIDKGQGGAQPNISQEVIKAHPIVIAPLAEQRRIVAKLKPLLGKVDAYQQRFAKIPVVLKRFRQAVLAAACSGQLTVDWRKNNPQPEVVDRDAPYDAPEIPESWQWKKLSDISQVKGGVTKGRKFNGKMTILLPYLRVANVQDGYLDLTEIKEIEVLPEDKEKYALKAGDILFTEGGDRDKLGRGTVWHGEITDCIHQNHIFRARLFTNEANAEYVSIASKSDFSRKYFFENASQTVNLASINLTMLSALPIPLAPFNEQQEIVRHVETLFKLVDQIEGRYQRAKPLMDKLQQSILAKAFRGELVPTEAELARREGRDYEPASVLLERIKSERAEHAQGWKEKVRSQPRRARLARGAKPHI